MNDIQEQMQEREPDPYIDEEAFRRGKLQAAQEWAARALEEL